MLFWALLASGQITMRKVDGWQSLDQPPSNSTIDLAVNPYRRRPGSAVSHFQHFPRRHRGGFLNGLL